jgi:outer membrane protein
MNHIKKIIFLIFFSSLYSSLAYSNDKIVFFDIEYAVSNSIIGKKVISNLNKIKSDENKKLKIVEDSLKKKNEEIKNLKNIISKEELQKKINQFQNEIKEYNINKDKIQKDFTNNKNKQLEDLFKKINPLIIKFMSDNSIDLILSKKNIYLGKTNLDITESMVKLINENFK